MGHSMGHSIGPRHGPLYGARVAIAEAAVAAEADGNGVAATAPGAWPAPTSLHPPCGQGQPTAGAEKCPCLPGFDRARDTIYGKLAADTA